MATRAAGEAGRAGHGGGYGGHGITACKRNDPCTRPPPLVGGRICGAERLYLPSRWHKQSGREGNLEGGVLARSAPE